MQAYVCTLESSWPRSPPFDWPSWTQSTYLFLSFTDWVRYFRFFGFQMILDIRSFFGQMTGDLMETATKSINLFNWFCSPQVLCLRQGFFKWYSLVSLHLSHFWKSQLCCHQCSFIYKTLFDSANLQSHVQSRQICIQKAKKRRWTRKNVE